MIDPLAGIIAFIGSVINEIFTKAEIKTEKSLSPPPPSPLQRKTEPKPSWYQEPHRDPVSGKIVIENCKLYNADVAEYGAVQAQRWVEQGRYNLTPAELKKEEARIRAKYDYLYSLKR